MNGGDAMVTVQQATLTPPVGAQDHVQGPTSAPVTLVEYGDFECPFCGRAHPIVKTLQRQFDDLMRFAFRHFPLTQAHPHAQSAAEAAEAAGAQGTFWPMHDMLFEHQYALEFDDLVAYAAALDLDVERFAEELATGLHRPRVREHFMSGVRSGVNGTPTFFINGRRHDDAWDLETLGAAIQRTALHSR
jgi:protein-disulfide isomerase